MKKRTKILIVVGIIVLIMIAGILYLVALDEKQNELLTEELAQINSYAQSENINNEELQAILNRTVTTGDYAKIEVACKQYLTDLLDRQEKIKQILEDEELTKILSAENYQADGPEFVNTKQYITTTKTNLNQYMGELIQLLSKEKMVSYIEKQNIDASDIEIYEQDLAEQINEEELKDELQERLPLLPPIYTGIIFPLRRVFLGRTIRKGMNQVKLLRLFQYGKAQSEVRLMDEHIQLLEGETIEFTGEFADDNLNNLSWWTNKHVGYAIREAVDLLDIEYDLTGSAHADNEIHISTS